MPEISDEVYIDVSPRDYVNACNYKEREETLELLCCNEKAQNAGTNSVGYNHLDIDAQRHCEAIAGMLNRRFSTTAIRNLLELLNYNGLNVVKELVKKSA